MSSFFYSLFSIFSVFMLFLQKEGFCSEEKTLRDETLISSEESIKKKKVKLNLD